MYSFNEICESFPGRFAGDYTFAYVRPEEPGYVSSLADNPFFCRLQHLTAAARTGAWI